MQLYSQLAAPGVADEYVRLANECCQAVRPHAVADKLQVGALPRVGGPLHELAHLVAAAACGGGVTQLAIFTHT